MKEHDLGKDCLAAGPAYRAVPSREVLPANEVDHYQLTNVQDALETAGRAEGGFPLDGGSVIHAKELDEEGGRSKYHHSVGVLKPFRSTSKHEHPVDNAGLFSFMTISWLTPLAKMAHKKGQLLLEDIWAISRWESCETNSKRLAGLWEKELNERGDQASLHRVVWLFCRTRLLLSILCLMVTQLAGFSGPVSNTISAPASPFLSFHSIFLLSITLSFYISLALRLTEACPFRSNTKVSVFVGHGR